MTDMYRTDGGEVSDRPTQLRHHIIRNTADFPSITDKNEPVSLLLCMTRRYIYIYVVRVIFLSTHHSMHAKHFEVNIDDKFTSAAAAAAG